MSSSIPIQFIRDSRSALQARYKESMRQPSKDQRPLPSGRSETEWLAFINGAKRKKIHKVRCTGYLFSQ